MNERRRAELLCAALVEVDLTDSQLDAVLTALAGWRPPEDDEWIPYNIDIDTRHRWLPGADEQRWPHDGQETR